MIDVAQEKADGFPGIAYGRSGRDFGAQLAFENGDVLVIRDAACVRLRDDEERLVHHINDERR
jgi:hypothetical protein